jgi:protein MpaA
MIGPVLGLRPGRYCAVALAAMLACGCAGRPATARLEQAPDFLPHHPASVPGAAAYKPHVLEAGLSVDGQPLIVEIFGAGPRTTLVIGSIHGDETRGTDMARRLAAFLRADPEAMRGRAVAILAAANPDGAARHCRANANGVDLNRNFPAANWRRGTPGRFGYGGPTPASEPETQAIIRLVETLRPDRVVSLHATSSGEVCNNYDGPAAALARLMAARNHYPVVAHIGHPTPGSLGNWLGVDRGVPTLTLELPQNAAADACWERNRAALLEAVTADAGTPEL